MPKNHFYDDPDFLYQKYWVGREYEDQSEKIAISKLLKNVSVENAADIGGGYGRITKIISGFANNTTLIEPSEKMRREAKKYLSILSTQYSVLSGEAEKTGLDDDSQDLVSTVRVMHHISDPGNAIREIARILKPHGLLLLEYANSTSLKSQIKSIISGRPILLSSVERRRPANIRRGTIPFVNHHPHTIRKLLYQNGFVIKNTLSVSNFRIPLLKKLLPLKLLLVLESVCQKLFSYGYIGPSIFILAELDNGKNP